MNDKCSKILVCNIGNTNFNCGLFEDGSFTKFESLPTIEASSATTLLDWFQKFDAISCDIVVCSVAPKASESLRQISEQVTDGQICFAGENLKIPMKLDVTHPKTVGKDRLVNCWEAYRRYGQSVTVDFGTAVTLDMVDNEGTFLGGIILPGQRLMAETLHEKTAQLPLVTPVETTSVIGKNTNEAISVGLTHGLVSMIDGLIERLEKETGNNWKVLATGGDSLKLATLSSKIEQVIPDLTMWGLVELYKIENDQK